jgi:hypothetical protein
MPNLDASIVSVEALDDRAITEMFALYDRYYEATNFDLFRCDLRAKEYVVLLSDASNTVRGFTTLAVSSHNVEGHQCRALFSGDTIIDPAHWGEQSLAFAWLRFAGKIKAQDPDIPLYWFLIVKGHRTYRYLSAFSKIFFPSWTQPTPQLEQQVIDHFAASRFGEHYDYTKGLIKFESSRGQLRPELADVPQEDRQRPDVRFFLARNPGYRVGHELACLTELDVNNLRPLARRIFQRGMQE